MRHRSCSAFIAVSLILAVAQADQSSQAILETTGVKGGLIVHLGCGNGRLTAELATKGPYLVQGLDTDPKKIAEARTHLQSRGLYGTVSITRLTAPALPYIDNLVNLVLVEKLGAISTAEVMRVLAPEGVAYVRRGDSWEKSVKPRPATIDEWTHYLHGPDNNAVANDRVVALPYHVQWIGAPKWARHHNHLSSTSSAVSASGRLFAIVDEAPAASLDLPPLWSLVARDAFNGVVLWKKRVGPWEGHLRPFRSGPTELSRRLVAARDRVYVTLGYGKPLVALDAATGETVKNYDGTDDTVEIIHAGDVLFLVLGSIDRERYTQAQRRGVASPAPRQKKIVAIHAASGKPHWVKNDGDTHELLPSTLCVGEGNRLFFQNLSHLVCLDGLTGALQWRKPRSVARNRLAWSTPTVVAWQDVVFSADAAAPKGDVPAGQPDQADWKVTPRTMNRVLSLGELIAFSAKDGKELWRCPSAQGYNSPADVFVAGGLVWTGTAPNRNTTDFTEGRDPRTGEIKQRLDTEFAFTSAHHHRCYRNKATERFILLGRTGVEVIDLAGGDNRRNCWIRGACQYGVLPANGLLYLPPHSCACYIQSKLSGFWALAPKRASDGSIATNPPQLERGPACATSVPGPTSSSTTNDWPTHRGSVARTGSTAAAVPTQPAQTWAQPIGGKLSSPVIAEGSILVAAVDRHTVHAFDAASGTPRWTFTAEGRIDSPPTIYASLVIFGCTDGYIYCLRRVDGVLAWRFRAAPTDRRTVSFGQIESVWPVTGSVLIHEGVIYALAGRSSYLDEGMFMYKLIPHTGRVLDITNFYDRDLKTGSQDEYKIDDVELAGMLPDVLSCDGKHIFLRDNQFDLIGNPTVQVIPHLYSSVGLLDDHWWHRTYWMWSDRAYGRAAGWHVAGNHRPSGRILVLDEKTVFGYGRERVTSGGKGMEGYHLFRADKKVKPLARKLKNRNAALSEHLTPGRVKYHWSRPVPLVVRAMVLADKQLIIAGPRKIEDREGGQLLILSATDGTTRHKSELKTPPVFDGLAAADGRLYLTTIDGQVICFDKP